MINELDSVVLTHDRKEYNLLKGDLGAVVHVYSDRSDFEVEFVTAEGKTVAVPTLSNRDIHLMHSHEILHARNMQTA